MEVPIDIPNGIPINNPYEGIPNVNYVIIPYNIPLIFPSSEFSHLNKCFKGDLQNETFKSLNLIKMVFKTQFNHIIITSKMNNAQHHNPFTAH
jgi:hypothetical protein